jgi:hypothetical protein
VPLHWPGSTWTDWQEAKGKTFTLLPKEVLSTMAKDPGLRSGLLALLDDLL